MCDDVGEEEVAVCDCYCRKAMSFEAFGAS